MSVEKRRHPRVELNSTVLVAAARGGYLCNVHDVSAGGCRVSRPLEWSDGEGSHRLFFIFDQDTVIELTGRLVRRTDAELCFEFLPEQEEEGERLMYETRFAAVLG